ncbi:MAG: hypothetical protein WAL67_11230, partial [Candidatus Cybelea sp.]
AAVAAALLAGAWEAWEVAALVAALVAAVAAARRSEPSATNVTLTQGYSGATSDGTVIIRW